MSELGRLSLAGRLRRLIEAGHRLATVESCQVLLPELIRLARDVVSAQACSIQLYDQTLELLEFAWVDDEVLGAEACHLLRGGAAIRLGEGVAGWVAAHRRSALIADVRRDERFRPSADRATGFTTRTLLSVPLVHQSELLGVLNAVNCKNKPAFDRDDQEILESFADLAAVALVRTQLLETKLRQEKLRTELATAAQIQRLLQPKPADLGHGSRFWATSLAAGVVGGDLCDLIPRPDGSWLAYVADVSGKGLAAAMVMTALWSRLRGECARQDRTDLVLAAVNEDMVQMFAEQGFFATIVLVCYQPADGTVAFTCAGHDLPLRVAGGRLKPVPRVRGLALGVLSEAVYGQGRFRLDPGESVVMITDGVTEATDPRQRLFGRESLAAALGRTSAPPYGPGLIREVELWSAGSVQEDDLTIAEIYRPGRDPDRAAER